MKKGSAAQVSEHQPIVSIIIPIYNVEPYLRRCLDSVLRQTLSEIELICIDDGSTDGSLEILTTVAQSDERIRVLSQENSGPAVARKLGIQMSIGKYIGFVDSDDWIAPTMYEKLVEEAEKKQCQLTLCDGYRASIGSLNYLRTYNGNKLTAEEFMDISAAPFLCMKLFRSDLKPYMLQVIGKTQAEDVGLLYITLPHVERIGYVSEPLYYYFQRRDSSSHSDSFVCNYQIDEYLDVVRYLFHQNFGKLTPNAQRHFVQMIYYGLNTPARMYFRAEYIEFLQEISSSLVGNAKLKCFNDLTQYLCHETIPSTLVCHDSVDLAQPYLNCCQDSWSYYARHCQVVVLPSTASGTVPEIVSRAAANGKTEFVEDYIKLRYIYENGGIAIRPYVKLNKPLGELRAYSAFWGYGDKKQINPAIWGAIKAHPLIEQVLHSYEENTLLNQIDVSLGERFYFALCRFYKLTQQDANQHKLGSDAMIFRCDKLTYKVNTNNVAQVYSAEIYQAEQCGLVSAPQAAVEMLIQEARKDGMRKKGGGNASTTELTTYYKNELQRIKNSRSWKITKPLRKLFNFFRKRKYSAAEIE